MNVAPVPVAGAEGSCPSSQFAAVAQSVLTSPRHAATPLAPNADVLKSITTMSASLAANPNKLCRFAFISFLCSVFMRFTFLGFGCVEIVT
jgi:hypothetical protein